MLIRSGHRENYRDGRSYARILEHKGVDPGMERKTVDIGETTLSILDAGSGSPLVFVHGAVTTSELCRDVLDYYAPRYRAIAVDLRGYGDSAKPGHGYNIDQFAKDLAPLCDELDLPRAVLLGVSMGGWTTQRFALDSGKRLNGVVLASTSNGELTEELLDNDPREKVRNLGWRKVSEGLITGAFPPDADPAIVNALLSRIETWNEQVVTEVLDSIMAFDTSRELSGLKTPTLLMVGSEDHQLPVSLSENMHGAIPDSRLEVFQGSGHFMMLEDPTRFYSILDGFLAEIGH